MQLLYSIADAQNYLKFNREPIDELLRCVRARFVRAHACAGVCVWRYGGRVGKPSSSSPSPTPLDLPPVRPLPSSLTLPLHPTGRLQAELFPEHEPDEPRYSLAIIDGAADGARLAHSHQRQWQYVRQSLMLWREITDEMYRLWYSRPLSVATALKFRRLPPSAAARVVGT